MNALWRRIEITGDSMRPTLVPGDRVLAVRWPPARIRPGHVVAVQDPRQPRRTLVKRVDRLTTGGAHLVGDRPGSSTDSRHFGAVPLAPAYRVVYRYAPPHRAGRVGRT